LAREVDAVLAKVDQEQRQAWMNATRIPEQSDRGRFDDPA
jgi:hypothetical protein